MERAVQTQNRQASHRAEDALGSGLARQNQESQNQTCPRRLVQELQSSQCSSRLAGDVLLSTGRMGDLFRRRRLANIGLLRSWRR